jgi:hypothetical protein
VVISGDGTKGKKENESPAKSVTKKAWINLHWCLVRGGANARYPSLAEGWRTVTIQKLRRQSSFLLLSEKFRVNIMTDIEAQLGRRHSPKRLDGFPALSYFMGADQDAAIFQRFDRLSARNLPYLQSNLNDLQAKLDQLDQIDAKAGLQDAEARLSAKAYSDLKAKARWYRHENDKKKTLQEMDTTEIMVQNREDNIGADALERVELHRQIKEAMRDYRERYTLISYSLVPY